MDYADYLVTKPEEIVKSSEIIKAFNDTNLSLLPFAKAIDITGEGSLELIEAFEIRNSSVETSLTDANWVSYKTFVTVDLTDINKYFSKYETYVILCHTFCLRHLLTPEQYNHVNLNDYPRQQSQSEHQDEPLPFA